MRLIIASLILSAAACTKPSELQATAHAPGPPPPSGDEEVIVREPPKMIEIQHDVIRLKPGIHINFATDSDQIMPESDLIVKEVALVMSQNERITLRIEGHTDNTASQDHNQALSERRAKAVRDSLEHKGIEPDRIGSLGCGENVPVADNSTDDGKAQNRRVEFVIVRKNHPRGNCELYHPGDHTAAK